MSRATLPVSVLVVSGALGLAALVAVLVVVFSGSLLAGSPDAEPLAYTERGPGHLLREKLGRPINLDKGIGPNCTLKDALEFLAERYDITILVDSNAFAAIGVQKVEECPVQLPKMSGVSLAGVLRLLVGQVKGDMYVGTFHIRDGSVEVTTTYHEFMSPIWLAEFGRPHVPNVSIEARGQNLEEVLAHLADTTSINVVLDARVRDRARRMTVTTPLRDVPLDTALRLLADMAELGVAVNDNVFYVTDTDNARLMQSAHDKLNRTGLRTDPANVDGAGGAGMGPGPASMPR